MAAGETKPEESLGVARLEAQGRGLDSREGGPLFNPVMTIAIIILCLLCFLVIVNWQLYLMVSVEFSQGGQYLQNNSCKTKLNVFQLPENGDLGKI